jgi:hypothetical protein
MQSFPLGITPTMPVLLCSTAETMEQRWLRLDGRFAPGKGRSRGHGLGSVFGRT